MLNRGNTILNKKGYSFSDKGDNKLSRKDIYYY